jgi:hypothetical protein
MRNNKDIANTSNTHSLPAYLAELLQPTPSGVAKLIAAWDGLSTESQILVLTKLDESQFSSYWDEKIRIKALGSENPYVRYLAARRFSFLDKKQSEEIYGKSETEKMEAVKKRIEEDPAPLVRYSTLEQNSVVPFFLTKDYAGPDYFFSLPQEARLAKVRCLGGWGEKIVNLISHSVDHQLKDGTVSEIELFEILSDYLNNPGFSAHYKSDELSYDGYGEYLKGKDIVALWNLVLKVPERISYVLIQKLPEEAGLQSSIPEDVINGLNDRQLAELLYRKDIGLEKLRKKIFFEANEERWDVKNAASSYNFNLTYQEFAQILAKPQKEKLVDLRYLTSANGLSLCLYEAIHDALFISEDWEHGEFAIRSFGRRLSELQDYERDKEIRELRLYSLAKRSVPWNKSKDAYPPTGELEFLTKSIVEGDTWATFMAFSAAWGMQRDSSNLERYLPRINEIDEDTTDETKVDERQKPDHSKPFTKGDFILYNTQKWAVIWLWICFISVVVTLVFAGSAVYKFFMAEYGPALKSGFVAVIGLVMIKGARGQYSDLIKEQKRITDEMLE